MALVATVAALGVTSTSAHAEFGIESGSYFAKTHPTVPALPFPPVGPLGPHIERAIDIPAVAAAPSVAGAGAHADASTSFDFINLGGTRADGNVKDIVVDLPPGFVGNPQVVPACDSDAFELTYNNINDRPQPEGCSPASQVGIVTVDLNGSFPFGAHYTSPVYRIDTPTGAPAAFGFQVAAFGIVLKPRPRSDGDYGLAVTAPNINGTPALFGSVVTFWGVPADPIHDSERWNNSTQSWGASSGLAPKALLSNPVNCDSGMLNTSLRMDSWQAAGTWVPEGPGDPRFPDYQAPAPEPTGCEELDFGGLSDPVSLAFQPTSHAADSPSGYEARLSLPHHDEVDRPANPTLRDTRVTLPEGVVLNPSAANGLGACTSEQIGFVGSGFPLPNPIRFDAQPARCPDSSKVGSVRVTSPLLDAPLPGAVYLAKQLDNPFDSLLAIYIVIDDAKTGLRIKLAGRVETDPVTGRIVSTFTNNPQLPFTVFELSFFGGARASLVNPQTCGTRTTTSVLTPWSAPYTPEVVWEDQLAIDSGANGTPCLASESDAPNRPSFEAGTVTPIAGTHSPFVMKLRRDDGTQRLDGVDLTLPAGMSGKLAGVAKCGEGAIAQAQGRTALGDGAVEQAQPSCPAQSRIGTVTVGAGAGPTPFNTQGKAYLAGPYKGAPLSIAIVTPAVAGPFDLGVVTVRAALHVDRRTAQVRAVSDPLPTILEGIPLNLRTVSVHMDRPDFTLNPTSCEAKSVNGEISTVFSQAAVSNHFQVRACRALTFRPRLALRLTGRRQVRTGRHPGIRAQVNQTGIGEAGIQRAEVRLPKSLALDPDNAQALCEFVDGTKPDLENHCPKGSIVGRARAVTPLLDEPLAGNVYFVKNVRTDPKTGNQIRTLPMIVVALRGEVAVNLYGKSSTTPNGKLVNTFDDIPDAPITQFNLNIQGGNDGILAVTRTRRSLINLCAGRHTAETDMDGQNGRRHDFDVRMTTPCTKRQTKAAKRQAKRAAAKARAGSKRR